MKKVLQVVAIATLLLITYTVPSFADGNPWPVCTPAGCVPPSQ